MITVGPHVLTLLLFAISSTNLDSHGKLHAEWVLRDQQLASRLWNHLPPRETTTDEFLKAFDVPDRRSSWSLGFGLERIEAEFYGGYVSWSLQVLSFQGVI